MVVQASVNAAEYLNLDDGALGQRLDELPGDLGASVRSRNSPPVPS